MNTPLKTTFFLSLFALAPIYACDVSVDSIRSSTRLSSDFADFRIDECSATLFNQNGRLNQQVVQGHLAKFSADPSYINVLEELLIKKTGATILFNSDEKYTVSIKDNKITTSNKEKLDTARILMGGNIPTATQFKTNNE